MIPIAYNKNWKVRLNGHETKIYKADEGFMAVIIPQGQCSVEIEYVSEAFYAGCLVTATFVFGFVMLIIITHRKSMMKVRIKR